MKTIRSSDAPARSPDVPSEPYLWAPRFLERELIGRGGMCLVIRAFDTELERDVAIKMLPPDEWQSEAALARLGEEAKIAANLDHPHIVPVYEFGVDARGAPFLCMKLVEGETLEDTLRWAGPARLEPSFLTDLVQVFLDVCDAVSFAHGRGVLHRDIKPSNIMIDHFGRAFVLDWGVARSTSARPPSFPEPPGFLVGTPLYMSPEQLHGLHDEIDERTDVFALGATLYQILSGHPPHQDRLRDVILGKSRVSIAPPESLVEEGVVPEELSRIALKAMSHDPRGRYATVDELRSDIERFLRRPRDETHTRSAA
jgi:serine/threonine-protein kinase